MPSITCWKRCNAEQHCFLLSKNGVFEMFFFSGIKFEFDPKKEMTLEEAFLVFNTPSTFAAHCLHSQNH
jgi:hypothetical protein